MRRSATAVIGIILGIAPASAHDTTHASLGLPITTVTINTNSGAFTGTGTLDAVGVYEGASGVARYECATSGQIVGSLSFSGTFLCDLVVGATQGSTTPQLSGSFSGPITGVGGIPLLWMYGGTLNPGGHDFTCSGVALASAPQGSTLTARLIGACTTEPSVALFASEPHTERPAAMLRAEMFDARVRGVQE